jgi:hypothetical protein
VVANKLQVWVRQLVLVVILPRIALWARMVRSSKKYCSVLTCVNYYNLLEERCFSFPRNKKMYVFLCSNSYVMLHFVIEPEQNFVNYCRGAHIRLHTDFQIMSLILRVGDARSLGK